MKSCFSTAPQRYEDTKFKMTELGPIPGDRDVKTVLPCNLPLPFRVIRLKGLSPCH